MPGSSARRVASGCLAVWAALLTACAHVPPAPAGEAPRWPAPPATPQLRWVASFPDERTRSSERSTFGRVLDFILGTSGEPERPGDALLARPFGLAVAGEKLLAADPDGRQVLSISWRTGDFEPLTCPEPWVTPIAVAAGPEGSVFVADAGAGRVWRWSKSECTAIGAGALKRPTGLAFSNGRLWVVDPPSHSVVAFSLDGREQARIGPSGDSQLNFPTSIAVRADGALLVVDALNFRVVTLSPGGETLASLGSPGDGGGRFGRPKAVAVHSTGQLYVTDVQFDVVLVFTPDGRFEYAFGGSGAGPGKLSLPAGIAIGEGTVFVADSYNHRIQIYSILGAAP